MLLVAQTTAMKPRIVATRLCARAGRDQRADERDAGDRVRRRHERRVQQRRHARDHHVADEAGQHEDVELEKIAISRSTFPSWVIIIAPVISSVASSWSAPSFTRCLSSSKMLRPNIWLAWNGTVLGTLSGAMIVTSCDSHRLAGLRELAVAARLRGEIDDHRAGAHRLRPSRRDQLRRRLARDLRRRDDEIHVLDVVRRSRRACAPARRAVCARA